MSLIDPGLTPSSLHVFFFLKINSLHVALVLFNSLSIGLDYGFIAKVLDTSLYDATVLIILKVGSFVRCFHVTWNSV